MSCRKGTRPRPHRLPPCGDFGYGESGRLTDVSPTPEEKNGRCQQQTSGPARRPAPGVRRACRRGARVQPGAGVSRLSRYVAHPPLRGESRAALRHGAHRGLLSPLYRPGGRRHRHAAGDQARRRGHHGIPRSRPHAGVRDGSEGSDGGVDRPARRLFQGQGRLDAHVFGGEGILRRAWHRRRPGPNRNRPRFRQQIPRQ